MSTEPVPTPAPDLRTRLALAPYIEAWLPAHTDQEASGWIADTSRRLAASLSEDVVEPELARLRAEVERLRGRIHEAVDETQRRFAPFQSRCHSFDVWSKWAREMWERNGGHWGRESEATRLVTLSLLQERDEARARLRGMARKVVACRAELHQAVEEWAENDAQVLAENERLADELDRWRARFFKAVGERDAARTELLDASRSGWGAGNTTPTDAGYRIVAKIVTRLIQAGVPLDQHQQNFLPQIVKDEMAGWAVTNPTDGEAEARKELGRIGFLLAERALHDADEPGSCSHKACARPAGPHGVCIDHSCYDAVAEVDLYCRLPAGHDGPWHDSGTHCWLVNGEGEIEPSPAVSEQERAEDDADREQADALRPGITEAPLSEADRDLLRLVTGPLAAEHIAHLEDDSTPHGPPVTAQPEET